MNVPGAYIGLDKARRRMKKARLAGRQVERKDYCVISDKQGRLEMGRVLRLGELEKGEADWKVLRTATSEDRDKYEKNKKESQEAIEITERFVDQQGLPMEILGAEFSLERSQLKFYFKAPHRVDFRGLLKELAREFSTRIELEQVGPRVAAAILGGHGRCGREFCCRKFLEDPGPIPMEFAQKQELSVSPDRLTGACGRLLCCLKFEHEDYVEVLEDMPELGAKVGIEDGQYEVVNHNVQTREITLEDPEGNRLQLDEEELESRRNGGG